MIEDDKLTIEERLLLYKKMLRTYVKSFLFQWNKEKYFTDCGFCRLIYKTTDLDNVKDSFIFELDLPELYNQKPTIFAVNSLGHPSPYWFDEGKILPRIKCLKKAIKTTKDIIFQEFKRTSDYYNKLSEPQDNTISF